MTKIKVMDELLANKIAAGEVVERCASVVKELVENSIDAGSTEIKVELIESGTKEIKVIDNGSGMEHDDAVLAFSRHATSKLMTDNDLYNINTLGFRGEALASIASVSRINLKTSTGNIGTIVSLVGGKITEVTTGDARKGTIITVSDLFFNTPARLKYMKSLYTELASITSFVNKIALSHPNIKFILINNGNVLLNTDGTGDLLKTIKSIYGIDVVKKMVEIKGSNDDYEVFGYITLPEVGRSNRNHMITLVNGRVVKNTELNKVINDSYHTYKPDNQYPIVIIGIKVDPTLVDVNIHPTKQDIKFSKMDSLMSLIGDVIKNSLKQTILIPKIESKVRVPEVNHNYVQSSLELNRVFESEPTYEPIINNDLIVETEDNLETIEEIKQTLPELYPIGTIHGTYIVCQNELGMYLIDQHAAKERINYEIYKEKLGSPKTETTSLLFPITIELTNDEFIILKENNNILINIGFDIEEFGINSIIIKSHPTWLPKNYEEKAIRKIIETIIHQEKNFDIEKFNENIAINLSCKLSIKANDNISLSEMENLINDLRKCYNPYTCPHGRPTIIHHSKYELEKLFKRSGF
ncbi:MAG: DNA mismatch repair endonuclease MutL [Bacilli bacterium]|nr:DNA mismatch repair endonuclease MutL [Bacilli bacterium]MDD4282403.1 DNA mismatch repair endonuclease MutL [Bacilli bacterium]MDD4718972.1 DNA mismatch repair endonuclease MutL [Bacilli bacterium]